VISHPGLYIHGKARRRWCRATVLCVTPCLFQLYSVITSLYDELPNGLRVGVITWPGKTEVTFSDALTAVRRWVWSDGVFAQVRGGSAVAKLPAPLREVLYPALAPTA
jgi:hypothetical protein